MFEESIRNTTLGLTIALSAVGFAARSAEADQGQDTNNRAVAEVKFDPSAESPLAEVSVLRHESSGALQGFKAPILDGAVPWSDEMKPVPMAIALGSLGLLFGAVLGYGAGEIVSDKKDRKGVGLLTGAVFGASMLGGLGYSESGGKYQRIDFETQIAEVVNAQPAHYESQGKSTIGPLFGQVVMIPELSIPLAVNNPSVPLIPGQRINASFWADSAGHIVSWHAESALRPQ